MDISTASPERARIGISSCLLGEAVRYDGGHKRDAFLTELLGRYVEWVPVCPEVEMGLGVPRDTLRLTEEGSLRLKSPRSGADHTERLNAWSERRLASLAALNLCGYVFKRGSPSCGLQRVKVYRDGQPPNKAGRGLFASAVVRRFPNLPVEEEGRLQDPRLRENFVSSVFSYMRWMTLEKSGVTPAKLTRFHAQHKFLLVAHSQDGARRLGRIAAGGGNYFTAFFEVMRRTPTRKNHTNVLQHMAGYFRDDINASDRAELTEGIEAYRRELVPLIVPVTLLRHYVRKFDVAYLRSQVYLNPHPHELSLLNQL